MTNEQVLAAYNLIHKQKIDLVKKLLAREKVEPLTEVRVYVDGPTHWHATVATIKRVYIFHSNNGIIDIQYARLKGFCKNGSLIYQTFKEWLDSDFMKGYVRKHDNS